MKPRVIPPGGCGHCSRVDPAALWEQDMTDDLGHVWFKSVCRWCKATTRKRAALLSLAYPARRA